MVNYAETPADPADYLPPPPTGTIEAVPAPASGASAGDVGKILDYIQAKGYTFEPWQVAAFVTAIQTKPFVILAGISGTGKTRLPRLVAEATGAAEVVVVPVRPDWTDSSDLLGYTALDQRFIPGRLLSLCKRAIAEPETQFFFVLDEMNVARVEYYFAEVLSIIENRRVDAASAIVTDSLNPTADGEWADVYLPSNVAIVGTVNMDETTHGFSRKVLDRAFVIELTDVDLTDYGNPAVETSPPLKWSADEWRVRALRLAESQDLTDPVVKQTVDALVEANKALRLAQLQVGYRVRDEAALFCLAARAHRDSFIDTDDTPVSPLDLCIGMKVLPRIQGGGALIGNVLSELDRWMGPAAPEPFAEVGDEEVELEAGAVTFPRSHERVQLMKDRLSHTGFTSYWV